MEYREDSFYIEKVLNGQTDEFAYLINKHKEMVFSIARQITRNREDAEEITQDVFLKAFRNLNSFRKASRFSTWLYRIAYNETISRVRIKRVNTVELEEEITGNISEEEVQNELIGLDEAEQKALIDNALIRLPEEERILVNMFYMQEQSIHEISMITGLTENNVKVRLHRTRKRIYNTLNEIINKEFRTLNS